MPNSDQYYAKSQESLNAARNRDRRQQEESQNQDQYRQQDNARDDKYDRALSPKLDNLKNLKSGNVRNGMDAAKKIARAVSPSGIFAALKQGNLLTDLPFVCAFGFAIVKDVLDFVFNETVVLGFLFSILCTIFIFMMLMLVGSAGKKRKAATKLITKAMVLIAGGLADGLPGLGFFPIETLTVFVIYWLTLMERANAEK